MNCKFWAEEIAVVFLLAEEISTVFLLAAALKSKSNFKREISTLGKNGCDG